MNLIDHNQIGIVLFDDISFLNDHTSGAPIDR
jgi:hypothetical protein